MKTPAPLQTDAYKLSHKGFMPDGLQYIYANLTPRSSKYLPVLKEYYDNKVVSFSQQFFIKDFLMNEWNETFFHQPKEKIIKQLKRRFDTYLGKDNVSTKHFEELHDLGYLPISIKILPEGSRVNIGVPIVTIKNTHPNFGWLTNYLETVMSCELWKPMVNATITYEIRKMINKFALDTTGTTQGTEWSMHGFEFRGMGGRHCAAINGAAMLLNTCGTDTIPAIDLLENYYNADAEKELIAASVPASEHACASLGVAMEDELEFLRKVIKHYYPKGIVSYVSDTYDYWNVITNLAKQLKDDIINRVPNEYGLAKLVFRPDSGDPVKIICGDKDAHVGSSEYKGSVECLWDIFGGTISKNGYKILHERVNLIYGDSINQQRAFEIMQGLKDKGFASGNCNVVFGVGSFTMEYSTRDSLSLAVKATWSQVNDEQYNLFKEPKTDSGTKKSAKGLLRVDKIGNDYVLKDCCTPEEEAGGELKEAFRDGKLLFETSLSEIRGKLWS